MWQEVGELGHGLAPVNVAGMFEHSPAHLPTFPTIKYLPESLLGFIDKLPIVGGRLPFNAVVLLPVPKKHLKPPTLPHAAIPGFLNVRDTIWTRTARRLQVSEPRRYLHLHLLVVS